MNKVTAVIKREYFTRVKNKTFIILTLLVPVLIAVLMCLPILMSMVKSSVTHIAIIDPVGRFIGRMESSSSLKLTFVYGELESLKKTYKEDGYDALLYIPAFDLQYPGGITLYSENQVGLTQIADMRRQIEDIIEDIRFDKAGIDRELVDKLRADIKIESVRLSGEEEKVGNAILSSILGQVMGFIMYFVIFMYGAMVMRAVLDDKNHRIVEILVSSIKPFELMLGKIIGIAAVALTQLLIWIILISIIIFIFTIALIPHTQNMTTDIVANTEIASQASDNFVVEMVEFLNAPGAVNFPLLIFAVLFFFIFGNFFYYTMFAAIGSISDDEANSQIFTLPISIPIILSMILLINIVNDPHGTIAVWASIIPFSSPIIMLARIPFNVPIWQIVVSCVVLVLSFFGSTWLAGKIYRTGILLYGKRLSWKDVWKFLKA